MSIEGKKVKLHIGKIKEAIDAAIQTVDNPSECLSKCVHLLLISEISQRGVVVPLDATDEKLMQAIISTAGKALLDENQVKPPLIAGAAVISAMAAQKCSEIAFANASNDFILKKGEWAGAFQRCHDVNDDRLLSILKIATETAITKEAALVGNMEGIALLLQRIAFGNNLRASLFSNQDLPPMFKRSLDSCLSVQNTLRFLSNKVKDKNYHGQIGANCEDDHEAFYCQDAILPLKNLVRIADSKQNMKKVSELSLRLTQSYIGVRGDDFVSEILAECGCQLWNDINSSFVEAYSKQEKSSKGDSSLKMVMHAKSLLDKVDGDVFDIEGDLMLITLLKLLKIRVEFEHENSLVNIIGDQRYVASRNRSGLTAGQATRDACEEEVRRQLVTGAIPAIDADGVAIDYDNSTIDEMAAALCTQFLSLSADELLQIPQSMQDEICVCIERQIERLILRAQTIALTLVKKKNRNAVIEAWDAMLDFIDPLLRYVADKEDALSISQIKAMPKARQKLMVSTMEAVLLYSWMITEQSKVSTAFMKASASFLSTSLKLLKEKEDQEKKRREAIEGKVVTTSNTSKSKFQLQLEVSCRAARCYLLLSYIGKIPSRNDVVFLNCSQLHVA